MSIKYPVVPRAPGVPPVLRKHGALITAGVMLVKDSVKALLGAPSNWGIYKDGKPVIIADSVFAMDFRREWYLANYPIEKGNFASYNKVAIPFDTRVVLTRGGTKADRTEFLTNIEAVAASLELYDIVTPEYTYSSANIARYDYQRTAQNGATLLTVTIFLQEIRTTATSQFSTTELAGSSLGPDSISAAAAGAKQVSTGVLQQLPLPPSVPATAEILTMDNLPGFTKPLLDYTGIGFQ